MGAFDAACEKLNAWLLGTREQVPDAIAVTLMNGLFQSVPIFLGGVLNTTAVAGVAAWRHPTAPFIAWLLFEVVLGIVRLGVLLQGRAVIEAGRAPPRLLAALLSCAWAGSVGYGASLCLMSGDWVMATITCFSAAAMVCGICLRNFGTPRLTALMMFLVLAPCMVAAARTSEPIILMISIQLPIYILTIFSAAFSLHRMLVSRMVALSDLERSESLNDTILRSSPDSTFILDSAGRVLFSNQTALAAPPRGGSPADDWVATLPPEYLAAAGKMLENARRGVSGNIVTHHIDEAGNRRWFDIIANRISDESQRLIVVARDITHQKQSEARAIWMAQHDTLTGLPNRALLQERLDAMLRDISRPMEGALLILDVDNFKTINDTLGHDAGDSLLLAFAGRLRAAMNEGDLVARTGGDEFALIMTAASEAEVYDAGQRIFAQLRDPFTHEGRLLECGASIGACLIPRDGRVRSEVMKAADIALYAAKASGRGHLKIFEPSMMLEVQRHQDMIAFARYAIQQDRIVPHYQPKVSLRTSRIVGFEALLRWRDQDGELHGPEALRAAFEDPALGSPISDRMLDKVLADARRWIEQGLEFGHIAVNVAAADFRRDRFAGKFLDRLSAAGVPPSCIQIEVTETVFLGKGASGVEDALRHLSAGGIRIALDDFGTGYASLSHLNQFPVNLLKIDRSFIQKIGTSVDAEAISATVVNLGHCLGLEVIAEGVETAAQEAQLAAMGCDTVQGFLYSVALAAEDVPKALLDQSTHDRNALRA